MQFLFLSLFALGIVGVDQLVKYLIVANIPLYGQAPLIPGIMKLTYVQNTGAAFSSFQGMQWLFLAVFAVFTVAVIWEFTTKKMSFTIFERWCIAAIYAGGLGNMIDRLRLTAPYSDERRSRASQVAKQQTTPNKLKQHHI